MRIKSVKARQILNSKGHPTLEVEISTNRYTAYSSVPTASSKSKYEYVDIYDHDVLKFDGDTLSVVVRNIETVVANELKGKNVLDQESIDNLLLDIDATYDRSKLGISAITSISQCVAKLGALESEMPLYKYIRVLYEFGDESVIKLHSEYNMPLPVITILKSGAHNRQNSLPFQEIMLLPRSDFRYSEIIDVYNALRSLDLIDKPKSFLELLDSVNKFIKKSKYRFYFGIDFSASRYKDTDTGEYILPNFYSKGEFYRADTKKMVKLYKDLLGRYEALVFLEDVFDEDDFASWKETHNLIEYNPSAVQIVSDDLTAGNIERLEKVGILEVANNIVLKPTQVGTVTEMIRFASRVKRYNLGLTVSYRSGETEDTFISDLAVGVGAEFIRVGSYIGSECNSKINRLLQMDV